jgi:peroxiredoxin
VSLVVGSQASDFELPDQHGRRWRLSQLRGVKAVVVMFYPMAFTGTCTGELRALREDLAAFQNDTVALFTVSCDPMPALRVFAEQEHLDFPLLSDFWPHGEVTRAYGVFDDGAGRPLRGTFILDRDGIVRWCVVNGPGEARNIEDYTKALADL